MGKNNKRKKHSEKIVKSIEQRKHEVKQIHDKLMSLGLTPEMDSIQQFFSITNDFIEKGISRSGEIKLEGLQRTLVYILPMRPTVSAAITLRFQN